jgi:2-keto-4-pentenoate hydratase
MTNMQPEQILRAATVLWQHWSRRTRLHALPDDCRPHERADGYRIQAEIQRISGQSLAGWKIAATSAAGQRHIGVDGPLAGRLLSGRVLDSTRSIPLDGNIMCVAEAEFAFRFGRDLPSRSQPYVREEVLAAVDGLSPAIEIPDSRYEEFVRAGAAQLIADNACACWFVPGHETTAPWRARNLAEHRVTVSRNGQIVGEGSGANVLGDPLIALTWIANELSRYEIGLQAGQIVTTGTCVAPVAIAPGDALVADFGDMGKVSVRIA